MGISWMQLIGGVNEKVRNDQAGYLLCEMRGALQRRCSGLTTRVSNLSIAWPDDDSRSFGSSMSNFAHIKYIFVDVSAVVLPLL
jgi:hypothetical protein